MKTVVTIHSVTVQSPALFSLNISLGRQKLCTQNGSACRASQRVMGQSNEFPVVNRIFSQPAYGNSHSLLIIHIQFYLGTVIFFQILDKLLRRAGQLKLLGKAL